MSLSGSPKINPSSCQTAKISSGNDKNKWIIINENKTKKWLKLKGKIRKYKTHDNGSRPFLVVISDDKIIVFKKNDVYEKSKKSNEKKLEPWIDCLKINKFTNIFIGKNSKKYSIYSSYGSFTGNSIIVEIKPKNYIFIGDCIKSFNTKEPILEYYSVMGNNDVPYPFALSDTHIYLMSDMVYTNKIKGNPDPYPSFYGYDDKYKTKWTKLQNQIIIKK